MAFAWRGAWVHLGAVWEQSPPKLMFARAHAVGSEGDCPAQGGCGFALRGCKRRGSRAACSAAFCSSQRRARPDPPCLARGEEAEALGSRRGHPLPRGPSEGAGLRHGQLQQPAVEQRAVAAPPPEPTRDLQPPWF